MARYIDADLLLQRLTGVNSTVEQGIKYYNSVYNLIIEQPTADVEEVVRCKDCKCCEQCYPAKAIGKEAIVGWYCNLNSKYVLPTHYCGYGERRDG